VVYIFGFFGFVMGFAIGLGSINVMLRHYSSKEIQANKSFKWTYGAVVWIFAAFGGWIGVWLYHNYFL
jgi:hypothetical protein